MRTRTHTDSNSYHGEIWSLCVAVSGHRSNGCLLRCSFCLFKDLVPSLNANFQAREPFALGKTNYKMWLFCYLLQILCCLVRIVQLLYIIVFMHLKQHCCHTLEGCDPMCPSSQVALMKNCGAPPIFKFPILALWDACFRLELIWANSLVGVCQGTNPGNLPNWLLSNPYVQYFRLKFLKVFPASCHDRHVDLILYGSVTPVLVA